MRRVEDVYIHEGTVNGDVFEEFVCTIPSSHTAVFQWYKQALMQWYWTMHPFTIWTGFRIPWHTS